MVNISKLQDSYFRIKKFINNTPILTSDRMNNEFGGFFYLKNEVDQVTGSFKIRGALSALSNLKDKNVCGVVAYSSGNHAQAVASASMTHGISSVIIMPKDAPKQKISNTLGYNAEVVFYDRYNEIREQIGENIAIEKNLTLIKPYDEHLVIAGQGTCGLEIIEQSKKLGLEKAEVLVCCGGGGLSAGISLALE